MTIIVNGVGAEAGEKLALELKKFLESISWPTAEKAEVCFGNMHASLKTVLVRDTKTLNANILKRIERFLAAKFKGIKKQEQHIVQFGVPHPKPRSAKMISRSARKKPLVPHLEVV